MVQFSFSFSERGFSMARATHPSPKEGCKQSVVLPAALPASLTAQTLSPAPC